MSQTNLVTRNDTILGVCQGLGEDFGFNPTILRLALILPIFWFPAEMLMIYLGLGLVVLVSRTLFKTPAAAQEEAEVAALPLVDKSAVVRSDERPLRDAA
ncbi:PspC domain-containing protein [Sphingomicrobium sp. XHP0239]|uniref:PspC domain-containing protein n=1 Tax=Sphingomicrobium maritimum TaxID=3133972 RepID=UPI0031CC5D2E